MHTDTIFDIVVVVITIVLTVFVEVVPRDEIKVKGRKLWNAFVLLLGMSIVASFGLSKYYATEKPRQEKKELEDKYNADLNGRRVSSALVLGNLNGLREMVGDLIKGSTDPALTRLAQSIDKVAESAQKTASLDPAAVAKALEENQAVRNKFLCSELEPISQKTMKSERESRAILEEVTQDAYDRTKFLPDEQREVMIKRILTARQRGNALQRPSKIFRNYSKSFAHECIERSHSHSFREWGSGNGV